MARRHVTKLDAEKYLKLIEQRWGTDVYNEYDKPIIREDYDGRGHIAIIWYGPFEWSLYSTTGSFAYEEREPEWGTLLPKVKIPASLKHIFSEPANPAVLMLYLEG